MPDISQDFLGQAQKNGHRSINFSQSTQYLFQYFNAIQSGFYFQCFYTPRPPSSSTDPIILLNFQSQ